MGKYKAALGKELGGEMRINKIKAQFDMLFIQLCNPHVHRCS